MMSDELINKKQKNQKRLFQEDSNPSREMQKQHKVNYPSCTATYPEQY
jgi:hypothetical protein